MELRWREVVRTELRQVNPMGLIPGPAPVPVEVRERTLQYRDGDEWIDVPVVEVDEREDHREFVKLWKQASDELERLVEEWR